MSFIERLSIQQRCGKRKSNFVQNEKDSIRKTLISRANKLKEKIAQETNNFDFSVQKAMNQTLREVQKHKQDFQQKHHHLQFLYQGEQYERKKILLKEELHKKLQTCKNQYKQKITIIKDKKKRFYTSNSKANQQMITIQDMLTTVKNKFKFQRKKNIKIRNKSEIIHLKKVNQQEIINFVQKNYPGQCALTFKSNKKQDNQQQISIDMIKAKGVKIFQSCESMTNQLTPQKVHATDIINIPSHSSKKSLIESFKNKSKLLSNDNSKNHQRQISNTQNLSNSERSIFIPLGKVALSNERKRICTEFQVTNSHKREEKNLANKRSSQIVDEFVEIQISEKNSKQNVRVFLPLNKKLKTEASVIIRSKNLKMQSLIPIKTSRLDHETQSEQMKLLSTEVFDEISPKFKCIQKSEEKNINEEEGEIQCLININDLHVQGEKQRKELEKNGQNSGLKSILYNRKVNELSRKMMRNQLNSRTHHKKHLTSQYMPSQETISNGMLLDIRGNHMQLQKSVKIQKLRQTDTIDRE